MGEDEDAVAAVDGLFEELFEGVEFRRGGGFEVFVEESGVAAGLAEAEELGEGFHAEGAFAGSAFFELGDFLLGVLASGFVGFLLLGCHLHEEDLLDLVGELGGDLGLGAAEDVGGGLVEDAAFVPASLVAAGSGGDGLPAAGHDEVQE